MPRSRRPLDAEKIETYDEFRKIAKNFGQGLYNCIIIIGPPGRLKSSIMAEETKGESHLISGNAQPFEIFCELQLNATKPTIIVDDADSLYAEAAGMRLLNMLTNPKKPATVMHPTSAPGQRGLNKSFETSAKVCIIDNAWGSAAVEKLAALEDRARLFLFDPSPAEVHRVMEGQNWYDDDEVYKFIGDNLEFFDGEKGLSTRLYVKATEERFAKGDWRSFVLKNIDPVNRVIITLDLDPEWKDKTVKEKEEEFIERTGLSRATYYNRKKALLGSLKKHPLIGKWTLGR